METVQHCIWEYQQHFRVSAQNAADDIFSQLDHELDPRVLLIGIAGDGTAEPSPVCLEPLGFGYDPAIFSATADVAARLTLIDGGVENGDAEPADASYQEIRAAGRTMVEQIERTLNMEDIDRGIVSFCSLPVHVNGYQVMVVLQLSRDTYRTHHPFRGNIKHQIDDSGSLLHATVLEFLDSCAKALNERDPGSRQYIFGRENSELVRAAANGLLFKLTYRTRQWGYPISLFDACNAISSLKYEGNDGVGTMLVSEVGHPSIEVAVELETKVRLNDHRTARKLLEMADDRICLLSDAGYIYGLGRRVANGNMEDLIELRFIKHYDWEIDYGGRPILRSSYGRPHLSGKAVNEKKFKTDARRIFPGLSTRDLHRLWMVALETTQQTSGTILIISTGAQQEADRLRNQCIKIKPTLLTAELARTVTAIDGAVLASPNGVCHAIGVILDGLATQKGSSSRGARYNSAVRYVETSRTQFGFPCLAVIVSEDGMIDLFPDLMPQIARSTIESGLDQARQVVAAPTFIAAEFNGVMDWFDANRFYVDAETAAELNRLIRAATPLLLELGLKVIWPEFTANPELDGSYFVDDRIQI